MPEAKRPYPEYLPLRRFAQDGLYSVAYLSLLVQRGSLRAKKIGRNYFTTKEDFRQYLEQHAREEIRIEYLKLLEPRVLQVQTAKFDDSGFFVGKKWRVRLAWPALILASLILISIIYIFGQGYSGRVAGVEEGLVGTSTITKP